MAITTLTRNGITILLSPVGIIATGQYWDGEFWVQVNPGTTIHVLGWTPATSGVGTGLRNGAMRNVRGEGSRMSTNDHDQGFDGRGAAYTGSLVASAPVALGVNDVFIVGASGPGNGATGTVSRPSYFPYTLGRSFVDAMVTVTVVASAPSATDFRPNAIGDPSARQRVSHTQINWGLLPSVYSDAHPHAPTIAECETWFAPFMGEVVAGWSSDQITPNFQHPGYGREMASAVSEALLRACGDSALTTKQTLVKHLIQKGIDLWGAWRDGRTSYSNGGHMQGRKALIIFAGHMLGDSAMADPDATLGVDTFREQDAYYQNGIDAWWGPRQRWSYNRSNANASSYGADDPATWTSGFDNSDQFFEHYHGKATLAASLGQAMAMGELGRVREWGVDIFASEWWHMVDHPAALDAAVPAQFEYYHNVPGVGGPERQTGRSHRASGGDYQTSQWPIAMLRALRPAVSYATPYASEQPLPVTFDVPDFDAPFLLEVTNAPIGATAAVVWIGRPLDTPVTHADGWDQWMEVDAGAELATVPNAYGYHREEVTIPDPGVTVRPEITYCLQVVYETAGPTFTASQPMLLTLPTQ